jgi:benzoyl-CoA 2,3-dioxygenase component B
MFVGETGVQRIVERTAKLMKEAGLSEDVRKVGGIDLPTMQKYLNLWFSLSLDLFGGEVSSNAAAFFASGLKGRAFEEKEYTEHTALNQTYAMEQPKDGKITKEDVALRNAMNEVLRDNYVDDSQRGVDKWNRALAKEGIDFQFKLPSRRFHRQIGLWSSVACTPTGEIISREEFEKNKSAWLPTDEDEAYVQSLMTQPVLEQGKMANWIAPPPRGIKGQPVDFEYVRHVPA